MSASTPTMRDAPGPSRTVFRKLVAGDPRGPGFYRAYVPPGEELAIVCARDGCSVGMPPGALVLDETGGVLQPGPETPKGAVRGTLAARADLPPLEVGAPIRKGKGEHRAIWLDAHGAEIVVKGGEKA